MTNSIYTALSRQQGLLQEMQVIANNLANSSTTGYKTDRAVFAEFIVPTGEGSLSMGGLAGHSFNLTQSSLDFTGGKFDLAIQGEGFFVVRTGQGDRLTRAGHFQLSPEGTLIDGQGNPVLSAGGAEIVVPDNAADVKISADGSVSVDGELIDRVGIVVPNGELVRGTGTQFTAADGFVQSEDATIIQGALEQSNVSPVLEVSRMIEVQRAYEAGQTLFEQEDKRISSLISAVRER